VARIVGLDIGERRIGIAVSDATAMLARPLSVLHVTALDAGTASRLLEEIARLLPDEDPIEGLVVGWPRRLDGSPNALTARVQQFAALLQQLAERPVHLQDERLTSREAESLLARREKNWRVRKTRIDATAAALILQDYLDSVTSPSRADLSSETDW
jgi:putative Holliday junction resolvase